MKNIQKVILMSGIAVALSLNTVPAFAQTYSSVEITQDTDVKIVTGEIPAIEKEGTLSTITINERYIGSLTSSRDKADRTIILSLKGTNYSFATEKPDISYTGSFRDIGRINIVYGQTNNKQDKQLLEVLLPYDNGTNKLGGFVLSGLKVEADKLVEGPLELQIKGSAGTYTDIKVAEVKSYGATLKALETNFEDVVAGDTGTFSFSVNEGMPDSFIPGRKLEFTLDKGYFYTSNKNEMVMGGILLNGRDISPKAEITPIVEDEHVTGFEFTIPDLDNTRSNVITFKNVLVYADVTQKGNVTLSVAGRGVDEGDSILIGQIKSPVKIDMKGFVAEVGVKNQIGGKVTLSETSKSMFNKGIITLEIDSQEGVQFRGEPDVEVIEGDLEVKAIGWDNNNPNLFKIRVTQKSSKASIIEISNFRVNVSNIVPDGTYGLTIGGTAISPESESTLELKNFLETKYETGNHTSNSTNNNSGNTNTNAGNTGKKTITKFVVGSQQYTVDGAINTMDAAPYVENGRTMVPLRYAVKAAGVNPDDVEFSKGVIMVPGSKLIKMTLGSDKVTADGKEYTMVTAPASVNGRTYVPISEIASLLDLSVSWDKNTKTATFEY